MPPVPSARDLQHQGLCLQSCTQERCMQTFPSSSPVQSLLFFHSEGTRGGLHPRDPHPPGKQALGLASQPMLSLGDPLLWSKNAPLLYIPETTFLARNKLPAYSSLTTGVFMSYSEK